MLSKARGEGEWVPHFWPVLPEVGISAANLTAQSKHPYLYRTY
jgi:hypothetical protein